MLCTMFALIFETNICCCQISVFRLHICVLVIVSISALDFSALICSMCAKNTFVFVYI